MGLQDLNDELHGRDFHLERTRHATAYEPGTVAAPEATQSFEAQAAWSSDRLTEAEMLAKKAKKKRIMHIAFGGLAVLVLLAGVTLKVRSLLYSEESIDISISGPRQVASAEASEFTVIYSNHNWSSLENATLIVSYPDTFQPNADSKVKVNASQLEITLGEVGARSDGKAVFSGKFYGSQGDTIYLKARLRYSPASVNSQFEKSTQYGVSVKSSILSVEMLAPQQTANDDIIEYVIDYANRSDKSLSNIRVKMEYPERFTFVSADPAPSEGDSVWYIGTIDPGKQGKIVAKGRVLGARDEVKKAKAMIGYFGGGGEFVAYGQSEQLTRIAVSPLSISQTVNGKREVSVHAGDTLSYVLTYKNEGNIGLRDAIVTMKLDSGVLDYRQLRQEQGSYDVTNKTLIWKASDIPGLAKLAPGDGGTIAVSIPVLNPIPADIAGKNFSIQTTAKIDSPDIPTPIGANKIVASNTLLTKVNSSVSIGAFLAENDSMFTNQGPIPPIATQETVYTVRIRLTNEYNDVTGAKLVITLPSSSRYQKKFAPDTEAVQWNERANELSWDLATYRAERGVARELRFQVAATPDLGLIDSELRLLNSIVFTGKDQFTKEDIRIEQNDKYIRKADSSIVDLKVRAN